MTDKNLATIYLFSLSNTLCKQVVQLKMFLFIITVLTLIFLIPPLKRYIRFMYLTLNLPGPPSWPLLGNGLEFWKKTPAGRLLYGK